MNTFYDTSPSIYYNTPYKTNPIMVYFYDRYWAMQRCYVIYEIDDMLTLYFKTSFDHTYRRIIPKQSVSCIRFGDLGKWVFKK